MKLEVGTGRSQEYELQPRDLPALSHGTNFLNPKPVSSHKKKNINYIVPS